MESNIDVVGDLLYFLPMQKWKFKRRDHFPLHEVFHY